MVGLSAGLVWPVIALVGISAGKKGHGRRHAAAAHPWRSYSPEERASSKKAASVAEVGGWQRPVRFAQPGPAFAHDLAGRRRSFFF
jgi:hypothetical protein